MAKIEMRTSVSKMPAAARYLPDQAARLSSCSG
jgi:hypothetical protein